MSVTIVSTVGATNANSYVTAVECTAFLNAYLGASEWTSAASTSPETQTTALAMAAARLDQEKWVGRIADSDQALQWPRVNALDRNGYSVSSTEIPQEIKDAQCLLALALLEDNDLLDDTGLEGFGAIKVGPVDVEPRVRSAGLLPAHVRREVRHYLRTPSRYQFPVTRG